MHVCVGDLNCKNCTLNNRNATLYKSVITRAYICRLFFNVRMYACSARYDRAPTNDFASDYLALLSAILFYRTDYDWISYKGALKTMLQFFEIISVI